MSPDDFLKNVLQDVKVDLTEEFDRNFERKAFFTKKWSDTRTPNRRGSLLARSGKLRRSIMSPKQNTDNVTWSSSLPYALMQNNGGEITVTAKMKSFFWAMYYKSAGAITTRTKSDNSVVMRETARNKKLSAEAQQWKNLALQKVGAKMKIEQRQFIGDHPVVRGRIEEIIGDSMKELEKYYFNQLKKNKRK
ncbi:hypothetical protein [Flavobacterium gelatinilyticum]|uniref:hypothetical protein n=1 Tax=Flavobacterium gelatinilyticum TaxID=3003260 RepID=UPI002480EAF9|nr:hypothetical protein [Flavobacterium gelatinilyticum]